MRILTINHTPIQSLDLAVYIIQQAGEGMLTIVAEQEQDMAEMVTTKSDTSNKKDARKVSRHKQPPPAARIPSESFSSSSSDDDSDDDYGKDDEDIRQGIVSTSLAPTAEEARVLLEPCPPEGVAAGGVWGTHLYSGRETLEDAALVSLVFGGDGSCAGIILCCYPQDEEPAYKVGRWVYAQDGSCTGHAFYQLSRSQHYSSVQQ